MPRTGDSNRGQDPQSLRVQALAGIEPELRTIPTEKLPDWLYVFVNQINPMSVMNLDITGQYISPVLAALAEEGFAASYADGSADFLPFIQNPKVSTGFWSPFLLSSINSYRIEHDAELARRNHFKDAPSRLTGIFAFESMADCQRAAERYGWNLATVQRFKPEVVLRATRVNMEIVSLAGIAYMRGAFDAAGIDQIWRSYWGGADKMHLELPSVNAQAREQISVDALWEWIIDGYLVHESRFGQ